MSSILHRKFTKCVFDIFLTGRTRRQGVGARVEKSAAADNRRQRRFGADCSVIVTADDTRLHDRRNARFGRYSSITSSATSIGTKMAGASR